jgi:2-dehydropantoate 2-reductase
MLKSHQTAKPRIAVLGSGAMGSFFGGALFESGADVCLLDLNTAHIDAINTQGLHLKTDDGERQISVPALLPRDVSGQFDLVLVFTKSMHTRSALSSIRAAIGPHTTLLSLQNGLDNKLILQEFAAPSHVLVGVTTYPADLKGPGSVESHGDGIARLAATAQPASPLLETLPALFGAAKLNVVIDPNVETAIWEKVAFNAALNGLCAVTGSTVGAIGAHEDTRKLAFAIVAEVCATAKACGFSADVDHVNAMVSDALAHHVHHKPSMLQDVLAGRPTEIEAINGAVVRNAALHEVSVPVTQTVLALVRHLDWRLQNKTA